MELENETNNTTPNNSIREMTDSDQSTLVNEQGQQVEHYTIKVDSDILNEIVTLRQQNNVNELYLLVDTKTFEVVSVRATT